MQQKKLMQSEHFLTRLRIITSQSNEIYQSIWFRDSIALNTFGANNGTIFEMIKMNQNSHHTELIILQIKFLVVIASIF